MLYISLGIERWYQRYSDCYLRLATKKVTEIDDDLSVILPSICSIDFGIHVFDVLEKSGYAVTPLKLNEMPKTN